MNEGLVLDIILGMCFALGAIAFLIINRKKDRRSASRSWLKYATYFLIILSLYLVIFYLTDYFRFICLFIILAGTFEIARLQFLHPRGGIFFAVTLLLWFLLSGLFYLFSLIDKSLILITFFTVSAFDAFSQVTGQLFGKRKIVPGISPNKTTGGFAGGYVLSFVITLLVGKLLKFEFAETVVWAFLLPLFAFTGDLLASFVKRRHRTKDFSHLIPGQGGFLDRFDSLIFAGSMVFILHKFM
jgi:phosphatidate cytidylyltransferase